MCFCGCWGSDQTSIRGQIFSIWQVLIRLQCNRLLQVGRLIQRQNKNCVWKTNYKQIYFQAEKLFYLFIKVIEHLCTLKFGLKSGAEQNIKNNTPCSCCFQNQILQQEEMFPRGSASWKPNQILGLLRFTHLL